MTFLPKILQELVPIITEKLGALITESITKA